VNSPALWQGGSTPRNTPSEGRCRTRLGLFRLLVAGAWCLGMSGASACGSGVEFGDDPAAVTSLGPVHASGSEAIVWFTTWDAEEDRVDVQLLVSTGGEFVVVDPATMAPRQTTGLTGGRREHARHAITWRFAESGISADSLVTLRLVAVGQNRPVAEWGPGRLSDATDEAIP
jgi:hypothetical protein